MKTFSITKKNVADTIFWFAFVCELLWFSLKKFDIVLPCQSLFLRAICGLFCLKILLTKYSRREWVIIVFCGLLGVIAYFASGRGIDILFRAVALLAASKDVSRTRAFKCLFYILFITDLWIILQGFIGTKTLVDIRDYGRGEVETRYTLGFSHANTLHFAMWSLMTLLIYLYHTKLKPVHYALIALFGALLTYLTRSRTGGLLMLFTLLFFILFLYWEPIKSLKKFLFPIGIFVLGCCLLLSVITIVSGPSSVLLGKLNSLLTGRLLWAYQAAEESFLSLFSQQGNELLIDMGYVRLIVSLGIVPAVLYILVTIYLLWHSCRTEDYLSYIFILSLILFTTIEAQQINCDITYNYMLIMFFGRWGHHLPTSF